MIDSIILAPYYWALKFRHFLYDKGLRKSHRSPVPAICIGNVTVGGTGKTPVTEMLLRLLGNHPLWYGKNVSVLSRGYGRKSKGFRTVEADGTARMYGDEPLQIKRKFRDTVVAVDRDRVEGCNILAGKVRPESQDDCGGLNAGLIILDDAFQYRRLKADVNIVLMNYGRPIYRDHLLPLGRLRDLPQRISAADMVIVTKCPAYLDEWRQGNVAENLGYKGEIFFTKTSYEALAPVFPEGDQRYVHSQRLILFSGIADDSQMEKYLSDTYRIVSHLKFSDHHRFTASDIRKIGRAADKYPTAIIVTTEKDSQRIMDRRDIPLHLRERMFRLPIRADFLNEEEAEKFISALDRHLAAGK